MKKLSELIKIINNVHTELQANAVHAVNKALTIRNWLIGYYIVEYEQNGEDRAEYGTNLLGNLASQLKHIKGLDERSLRNIRQFYHYYSYLNDEIRGVLTTDLRTNSIRGTLSTDLETNSIRGTLSTKLQIADNQYSEKEKVREGDSDNKLKVPANVLFNKLSYSHFEALLRVDNSLKRTFYEIECIKGTWSVRELKRQINSLYFERSGLSQHPEQLSKLVQQKIKPQQAKDIIKNIYAFDFLDINVQPIVEESDLERALLTQLQHFIIELGNGFCFETRQKRILIGEDYYFIDLVFYHRILKCHVLIDLKIGAFEHHDIGQLNTYLNYFKAEISEENDNAPVGILMVAEKDQALVKYATAGMDENLFVQQYLVCLPSKEQLIQQIENELRNFERK